MLSRRTLCAFLCTLPLAARAQFLDLDMPHFGKLRAFSAPDYTLITQDAGTAKLLVNDLASLDKLLATVLERERRPSGKPTSIYVIRAESWHSLLDHYPGTVFLPQRFANYILVHDHQRGSSLRSLIYPEYARLFLHEQLGGQYPLWFEEGLAGTMLGLRPRRDSASVMNPDLIPMWVNPSVGFVFLSERRTAHAIPLHLFMQVDAESLEGRDWRVVDAFNYQAWSTVYRALFVDSVRRGQTLRYLKAYEVGQPLDSAVEAAFGLRIGQLDETLRTPERLPPDGVRFKFPPIEAAKLPTPRNIDATEALTLLANALIESSKDGVAVDTLLEQAASLSPNSNSVRTLRLLRLAQTRDDAAFMKELQALEPATQDIEVARAVGLALAERIRDAEGPPGIRERAYELLDRSLAARPDDAEAAWAFGLVAAQLTRELPLAERRLQRAGELVPRSADIETARAYVYAALGQREQTASSLEAVAAYSRQPEQQAWARKRLQAMRAGDPR